jgi:hypothetical protein
MPIFRILNLGNEVPNLVSEFQNALVFLGLKTSARLFAILQTLYVFLISFSPDELSLHCFHTVNFTCESDGPYTISNKNTPSSSIFNFGQAGCKFPSFN